MNVWLDPGGLADLSLPELYQGNQKKHTVIQNTH